MAAPVETATKQRALLGLVCAGIATLIVIGRGAPALVFIAVVAGTFVAYAVLIRSLTRRRIIGARALILACLGLTVFAVAMPARTSNDVYAYIMYGRIVAEHHASPYTHVPADYPDDPALQRVQPVFKNTPSVYGPVFTGVSAAGMGACGSSPLCGRMFFQMLEGLALLGAARLVLRATGSWVAAACVGLNPVMLVSVVNGGHPDGLVATGLLTAVLIARERPVLAGGLLGIAALIKVNVLLPAVVLIGWLLVRDDKRKALTVGGTMGGVGVAGYLAAGGARALGPLHHASLLVSHHSVWYAARGWIANALVGGGWTQARAADYAAHLVPVLGLITIVAIALLVAGGRARGHGLVPVVAAALAVYVLVAPYVLPWYTAPLIALLALRWRSRTTWVLLAYSALLFVAYPSSYPVHRTFTSMILPTTAVSVLPVVELLLLVTIAVTAWRPRPKTRRAGALAEPS